MARIVVRLEHCAWRNGRPRFQPGPGVRALGFKGQDLRHGEAGPWFTLDEAKAFADARKAEIAAARAGAQPARVAAAPGGLYTIERMLHDWRASPRMCGVAVTEGKRRRRPLAEKTRREYGKLAEGLLRYDPVFTGSAAFAVMQRHCHALYERLWSDRGLAMANATLAMLSAAFSWAMLAGKVRVAVNPCHELRREQLPPRLRAATPAEIDALVAAADAIAAPEIGDAIMLGVWTAQRQNDRLALVDGGQDEQGRRVFRQSKTGALVAIPEAPLLSQRLAAARERRRTLPFSVKFPHVVVDERTGRPYDEHGYRKRFAAVRAAAAKSLPSLADFRDQDLRDTAVTWLARAGCTIPEISAITGHSAATAAAILKHYLAAHPEMADSAIRKVLNWHDRQTA
jgi:integrase